MKIWIRLFPVIFLFVFTACNGLPGSEDKEKSEMEKKVTKRNTFLNKKNSFSTFFFDSTALHKYFADNQTSDTLMRRMISFYNARNYQFAWFSDDGPTEQGREFWNMYKYSLTYDSASVINDKVLIKAMDRYVTSEDSTWGGMENKLLATELRLTDHFIRYYLNNFDKGYVKRKEMEKFVPYQKVNAIEIADSLVNKKHKDDKYFEDVNKAYGSIKKWIENYLAIHKKGGWPKVDLTAKQIKAKDTVAAVAALKKRLFLSGDMKVEDSSKIWTPELEAGIRQFQTRHGYTASGELTSAQLKDMNVSVESKIQQLLINLGRTQWQIADPAGKFIMVNIPEYILHVTENGKKVFDMDVVVGKEGHNTMIFTGKLNQVVFAPYWNVPESISEKEILPAMQRNPNYLASQNMEVVGEWGDGIPKVRQLPGPKNSLGKVKFLFPNSFDIYFHDTPAKSLFEKDKRAYSHGCIRLSDPPKMAEYLLKDDPKWDAAKIAEAMNDDTEKFVAIKEPVPVLITYYTAWVDDAGLLHFAEDIYGHDRHQAQKMFL